MLSHFSMPARAGLFLFGALTLTTLTVPGTVAGPEDPGEDLIRTDSPAPAGNACTDPLLEVRTFEIREGDSPERELPDLMDNARLLSRSERMALVGINPATPQF